MNAIKLFCKRTWDDMDEVGSVTSLTQSWGYYWSPHYCPTDYWIVEFMVSRKHSYQLILSKPDPSNQLDWNCDSFQEVELVCRLLYILELELFFVLGQD